MDHPACRQALFGTAEDAGLSKVAEISHKGAAVMDRPSFYEMLQRLWNPPVQTHAAETVEAFGWLVLLEGIVVVLLPGSMLVLLGGEPATAQAANLFRLVGVLVSGIGVLYVVGGRLNAHSFVFASLLDRPLVPPLMAVFWYLDVVPGGLALAFAFQDLASFVWTWRAWHIQGADAA